MKVLKNFNFLSSE